MKYDVQLCEVLRRAQTAENTFDYMVLAPKLAEVAQPGQFAHIYVPGKTLRRPISICDIDKNKRHAALCVPDSRRGYRAALEV